jgi:serine/threonine protein kinase
VLLGCCISSGKLHVTLSLCIVPTIASHLLPKGDDVPPFLPQVMHSDLKTKNVLLSNTMNAKISDVGLAQLVDAHSENAPVLAL